MLEAIKGLYNDCKGNVKINVEENEVFSTDVRVKQGCVMSSWLFNVSMDDVMQEVNARVVDDGAKLGWIWNRMKVINNVYMYIR